MEGQRQQRKTQFPGVSLSLDPSGITASIAPVPEDEREALLALLADCPPPADGDPVLEWNARGLAEFHQLASMVATRRRQLKAVLAHNRQQARIADQALAEGEKWWRRIVQARALPRLRASKEQADQEVENARQILSVCAIELTLGISAEAFRLFVDVAQTFDEMRVAERIWDLTGVRLEPGSGILNRVRAKSRQKARQRAHDSGQLDDSTADRQEVDFSFTDSDLLLSKVRAMRMGTAHGGALHLYPSLLVIHGSGGDNSSFALLDPRELTITWQPIRFAESGEVPGDATLLQDARAAASPLPVVLYGSLHFSTASGLSERWLLSNATVAERFALAWERFLQALPPLTTPAAAPLEEA